MAGTATVKGRTEHRENLLEKQERQLAHIQSIATGIR